MGKLDFHPHLHGLTLLSGRANLALAEEIASCLGVECASSTSETFPDGELRVEIHEDVRGRDVYLVQPTSPPVADHLLESLLLADACFRSGASRLTALIPYFGYARQDRRILRHEPVSARLVADLLCTRFERIVTVDLHNPSIEGFFIVPVEHLSATPLLAERVRPHVSKSSVVVAPDLGAVKLAQEYGDLLGLPVAYVHKIRLTAREVRAQRVIGEVSGRSPIVVDDMISTGETVISAVEAVLKEGGLPQVMVVATHGLFAEDAMKRLASLPIQRTVISNSVERPVSAPPFLEVVSLEEMLGNAIKKLHDDRFLRT